MNRLLFCLISACALYFIAPCSASSQDRAVPPTKTAQVEEIYVAHAVRQSRVTPTAFCDASKIGNSKALFEDQFAFRSVETNATNGRIVNADVQPIGNMHVCFGATADSSTLNFYANGTLATVPFVGKGECLTVKRDFPERGITTMRCFLDLQGLPPSYIGGQLTSNTVLSRIAVGGTSDPVGYTQPSIVTVRLWKRR